MKDETIESLTFGQAPNSLSKCKVATLKVRRRGEREEGVLLNKGEFATSLVDWGPRIKSLFSIFLSNPHKDRLRL